MTATEKYLSESFVNVLSSSLRVHKSVAHSIIERLIVGGDFVLLSARNDGAELELVVEKRGEFRVSLRVGVEVNCITGIVVDKPGHARRPGSLAGTEYGVYTLEDGWVTPLLDSMYSPVGVVVACVVGAMFLPPVPVV